MDKTVFLFPGQGQGSIKVGMGFDVWQHSPEARTIYWQADSFVGKPISNICFFGPEEELLKNAQLASLVVNLAYAAGLSVLGEHLEFYPKRPPDYLAGHSVGYLAALVYAGVVTLDDGLRIAQKRAELTAKACKENPGKMVVLINPNIAEIEEACRSYGVTIGNYNSETQIVLSGANDPMDKILAVIQQDRLAIKAVPLKTDGPFHTPSMMTAALSLAEFVDGIEFRDPAIPIIGNSHAQLITTGPEAKYELSVQIYKPVRWDQSMEKLKAEGVLTFIEMGNGEVLSNNLRRSLIGVTAVVVSVSAALAAYFLTKQKQRVS